MTDKQPNEHPQAAKPVASPTPEEIALKHLPEMWRYPKGKPVDYNRVYREHAIVAIREALAAQSEAREKPVASPGAEEIAQAHEWLREERGYMKPTGWALDLPEIAEIMRDYAASLEARLGEAHVCKGCPNGLDDCYPNSDNTCDIKPDRQTTPEILDHESAVQEKLLREAAETRAEKAKVK